MPTVSVIVRARDEAASIGRCLTLVRRQTIGDTEIDLIVVDNDSGDGTAAIAAGHGAQVLRIGRGEFTFGRALNLGASIASGEVIVALSAHAFAWDDRWLSRLVAAFDDPSVACASGDRFRPDGRALVTPVSLDGVASVRWPGWGFSNAAGAFRASLWRERGFREDLPGCEDLEWGRHWITRGYVCRLDPSLVVDHDHTHDPVRSIYLRARREAAAKAMFLPAGARPSASAREVAGEWWSDTRFYSSAWRARLSHRRAARLLGAWAGARSAAPTRPADMVVGAARPGRRG